MLDTRLTVVRDEKKAEIVCGLLRVNGLRCAYRKTDLAAAWTQGVASGGPMEILVAEADLETAQALVSTR